MANKNKVLANDKMKFPVVQYFKILETEENAGNSIVSETTRKNGSKVVVFKDGQKIVFDMTGALIRKFADGKKVLYSPKGKEKVVRRRRRRAALASAAKSNNKATTLLKAPFNPEELFALEIQNAKENGNGILSDRTNSRGIRKVTFEDGGKLHLHKTGVMIRKFPEGKKVQCTRDGKLIMVETNGTRTEINPDRTRTVIKPDGSTIKYSKTGQEVYRAAPSSPSRPPSPVTTDDISVSSTSTLSTSAASTITSSTFSMSASASASATSAAYATLHAVVLANDSTNCMLLIASKADVNKTDHSGQSPLHIASAKGNLELTALLLEHDSAANQKDKWGETPLHVVSQLKFANRKLEDASMSPETTREVTSDTVRGLRLHTQAAEVAKRLLCNSTNAADVNIRDSQGRTPLHAAALRGAYAVCAAIVENGKVDLAAVDDHGETALHLAIRGGSVDCVLYLLSLLDHASVPAESSGASAAVAFDSSALINCTNELNETALHMACMMDHAKVEPTVCALLYRGADVRCVDHFGRTALHIWCDRDDVDDFEPDKVVQQLLKSYPGLKSARTHTGATPLHLAVSRGRVVATRQLMKDGASICAVASVNTLAKKSLKYAVAITPLVSLRVGKFPAAVRAEVIAEYKKGQKAVASPLDDKAEVLAPPLSSSYSSPRNPIRWCSMIGFIEPSFVSSRERRDLIQMLLKEQSIKWDNSTWVPNAVAPRCMRCNNEFTVRFRKHHCRHCGHIFCASCVSSYMPIQKLGLSVNVRVCNTCVIVLKSTGQSGPPLYSPISVPSTLFMHQQTTSSPGSGTEASYSTDSSSYDTSTSNEVTVKHTSSWTPHGAVFKRFDA